MTTIRIGTRGSKLALVQANMVAAHINALGTDISAEIIEIETSGDWKPEHGETRLSTLEGGKAQFAKEIENALLDGRADIGVHSVKDMASFLPDGLRMDVYLERADARDALLSAKYASLDDLPEGASVGTSSLRRQAILLQKRPDLKIETIRGNVPTRIAKMKEGQVDAIILAKAGLDRLSLSDEISETLEADVMLPAVCQGIIGIEYREHDDNIRNVLQNLHCEKTGLIATAERAVLQAVDGSCHTPISSYAVFKSGHDMHLQTMILAPDGSDHHYFEDTRAVADESAARIFGQELGDKLKQAAPAAWIK